MGKRKEMIHIIDRENEILEKLGTLLIDYHNYYATETFDTKGKIFVTREWYDRLKELLEEMYQVVNGIEHQLAIGGRHD